MTTPKENTLHENRPGLSHLSYRIGLHHDFVGRINDALLSMEVTGGRKPLSSLTIAPDKPRFVEGYIDGCAAMLDVLTFYQEYIAGEGFLRTATERFSVQQLARAIGYELRGGLAAKTYLAFMVDTAPGSPATVAIRRGLPVMSIPHEKGKLPQTFETTDEFTARRELNEFRPVTMTDPLFDIDTCEVYLQGTSHKLLPGDYLLLTGAERDTFVGSEQWDLRTVLKIEVDKKRQITTVILNRLIGHLNTPLTKASSFTKPSPQPRIYLFHKRARLFGFNAPEWKMLDEKSRLSYATTHPVKVRSVGSAFSDTVLLCGSHDGTLYAFNAVSGVTLIKSTHHNGAVTSIAIGSLVGGVDGSLIVTGGSDGKVFRWDNVSTNPSVEPTNIFKPAGWDHVLFTEFVAGTLYFATTRGQIGRYTAITPAPVDNPKVVHTKGANFSAAAVAPTGKFVLTGSVNGGLQKWSVDDDFAKDEAVVTMPTAVHITVVSERWAVTIDNAGTLRFVDLKYKLIAFSIALPPKSIVSLKGIVLPGHADSAKTNICFITSSVDGVVVRWRFSFTLENDRSTKWITAEEKTISAHGGSCNALSLNDAGGFVSGGDDGFVRSWSFDNREIVKCQCAVDLSKTGTWPGFNNLKSHDNNGTVFADLDKIYPQALPESWVAFVEPSYIEVYRIKAHHHVRRSDFMLQSEVSRLTFDSFEHLSWFGLRETDVLLQSEELPRATNCIPITTPLTGTVITIDRIVNDLEIDALMVITGKRSRVLMPATLSEELLADDGSVSMQLAEGESLIMLAPVTLAKSDNREPMRIRMRSSENTVLSGEEKIWHLETRTGFAGTLKTQAALLDTVAEEKDAEVSELVTIRSVSYDRLLKRTTIIIKVPLTYAYDISTVSINANVIAATHGETVHEKLGSGDGAVANQSFSLRRSPLTFVAAANDSGSATSLSVRVNNIPWNETPSLYPLSSEDRGYRVEQSDSGMSTVTFGDGVHGARLPSGAENISAVYRIGVGPDGDVPANTIKLLKEKPLGIRSVNNPVAAAGSALPEPSGLARQRAPRQVQALGRVVSISDFEYAACSYPGVGKVRATELWDGENRIVVLSIAHESGEVLPDNVTFLVDVKKYLDVIRDGHITLVVKSFAASLINIAARVLIDTTYDRAKVLASVETALRDHFGFAAARFAKAIVPSDVVCCIHAVDGVIAVDLDHLFFDALRFPQKMSADYVELLDENSTSQPTLFVAQRDLPDSINDVLGSRSYFITREKESLRWTLRSTDNAASFAFVNEGEFIRIFSLPKEPTTLDFLDARLDLKGGTILPAELIIINPLTSGCILSEM